MIWTTEMPTQVGWYWQRDSRPERREKERRRGPVEEIVYVRNYAGRLAVGNSVLPWEFTEWAGPLDPPKE
jgi:hypothetical protein